MKKNIKWLLFGLLITTIVVAACKKATYNFGDIKTPADLTLTATVAGIDVNNPNGNGSGAVAISVTAKDAITYKIDFGDGKVMMLPAGTINYKYTTPGTFDYTITVNAIGTAGTTSTISKRIKVFVAFEIPADIVSSLTGGSSKTWVCDKEASGHFGVGPADQFLPTYYSADPNSRQPCAYDDEITFSKDANNNIYMALDNKGQSFIIGAAAGFYGLASAEDCEDVTAGGAKKLSFMNATSNSTTANSTRIQFEVPGNGLIIFGTGATAYEILSISPTNITLRNIGIDGNAWYQKLIAK